ncbi:GNAT family N-acetyltransferase [Halobaculum sp. MBLA0147]|uniref:GNAT family N-acetyltransferase n=1 Tax=Halobaculum sp. MBLA0147 TaxID=3079934 RepID=UPI003526A804
MTEHTYTLSETLPEPARFVELRRAVDVPPRSVDAAERGLPESLYGVSAVHEPSGETVGMARVVGDGATVFHVCDVVVHPDHQRRGLGTRLVDAVVSYLAANAPDGAYVNLLSDVDGFYEHWGFEETAPTSKGMVVPTGDRDWGGRVEHTDGDGRE